MQSPVRKSGESPAVPKVKVSARGAKRIKDGHVWVYRSDVAAAEGIAAGAVVRVCDERGKFLGTAFYSNASQIAIRLISKEAVSDLNELLRERVRDAIAYRERFVSDTDAYRVVFSEADFLPGLIVDRYNDLLSFQVLTQATDLEAVRQTVLSELTEQLHPAAIGEKVEPKIRELEQLPVRTSGLVQGDKSSTIFSMNGVRFHYDVKEGQKTGAFLDQRENYAAASKYAQGEALDAFCYHGGFALHLAPHCSKVTGLDSSRPALEVADRNAALNSREIEWIEGNAFDVLRDYAKSGQRYDIVVLDPPAFAKSKRDLDTALRGYKELNLRALKMLRTGGILVTCSCSYHVSAVNFLAVVAEAGWDAHREVRVLESRGQAKDHPVLASVPETEYLKCIIAYVSN
ncbi:MAG TPA: class I SAM-dependent rRNA methyltransferase [Terriglobales bacterium]|jgi:23S rRNA (cytosine1962-C5)-methyltransferase|nr:class I SAM-dependent rRNA methyltransferase [Terriglobales bacterium]